MWILGLKRLSKKLPKEKMLGVINVLVWSVSTHMASIYANLLEGKKACA